MSVGTGRTLPEIRPNTHALEFDPTLAGLLRDAPVTRIDLPYGSPGPWLVSRYADIQAITNDRRLVRAPLAGEVAIPRLMPAFTPPPDAVQLQDPPRASDLREAMGRGINSRRMRAMRATADGIAADLVERLGEGDGTGGPVDLMAGLTGRFPLDVMGHLIGIPDGERADVRAWTLSMFSTREEDSERTVAAKKSLGGYAAGLVADRMVNPGTDVLSRIVTDPDDDFTDGELTGMVVQMIAVGIAPSNALLSNICYLMLTRDDLSGLRADPARLTDVFEELARFTPVINGFGPPLVAAEDLTIGGVEIRRGDVVTYSYTSGNRDPDVFADPGGIDLTRREVKHLTFGAGIHACVGQHFARMIVTSALGALFTRFPGVRLAGPPGDVDWDNGTIWRHPVTLPVLL